MKQQYVLAIDAGTTSNRAMIFDHSGAVVAMEQMEFEQILPQAGWVEHDPKEIMRTIDQVIKGAMGKAGIGADAIAAVGVTNQRETTVVWNPETGEPYHHAIVWQDTRTDKIVAGLAKEGGQDRFRPKVGLPLATYFSGPKIKWLLDHVDGLRTAAECGQAVFGNVDTWIIWNLTGGPNGGAHVTDVTNASRTMLMDLNTLQWDTEICQIMGIPMAMLPEIRPSSDPKFYGMTQKDGPFEGEIPICGDLGDQQAATVGQAALSPGEAKNTYGTGCFMLMNTGNEIVQSNNGLLTTLCYQFGDQPAVYALEGSIAITGALVQWLRDNLELIDESSQIEELAKTVDDNGGIYFVPAFSGLYAPYWKDNARGVIAGLTRFVNKGHFARATLEATAYQTREVLDAMNADAGVQLKALKVDGGMVYNELLMQFQADILGTEVIRPKVSETTALGAAYAAGLAVGFWESEDDIRHNWLEAKRWKPDMDMAERKRLYSQWKKAVRRTFDWVD